jgi:hypothetical protein
MHTLRLLMTALTLVLVALAQEATTKSTSDATTSTPTQTPERKPTKAELKAQKTAAKRAAQEAAKEAQRRADTLSFALDNITTGCLVVDSIEFHREVQRGWGGLLNGGSNAIIGIRAYIDGVVRNNCNQNVVVHLWAHFYDRSGVRIGGGQIEQFIPIGKAPFVVVGTGDVSCTPECFQHSVAETAAARLQIF